MFQFKPEPKSSEQTSAPSSGAHTYRLAAVAIATLLAFALVAPIVTAEKASDGRFYQVVFVTVKDQAKYGEYLQALGPVVSRYGVEAHRILVPNKVWPEDLGELSFVNVVSYESESAYRHFERDPDFIALKDLRSQAIDMRGVQGHRIGGELAAGDTGNRQYMVEMVHYKDDDPSPFANYRRAAAPVMGKYGFHTEHRFEPMEAIGDLDLPDAVAIHFFDSAENKAAAEKDPKHGEIEGLYADAIEGLVWIEGLAFSG